MWFFMNIKQFKTSFNDLCKNYYVTHNNYQFCIIWQISHINIIHIC